MAEFIFNDVPEQLNTDFPLYFFCIFENTKKTTKKILKDNSSTLLSLEARQGITFIFKLMNKHF